MSVVGKTVELSLELKPLVAETKPVPAPVVSVDDGSDDDGAGLTVGAVITLSIGALALGGGAVTGFLTLDRVDTIKEQCVGTT